MTVLRLDDNYLEFNIRILTILGMWNPHPGNSGRNPLYASYAVGLFCLAGIPQTLAEVMHAWNNRNNMVMFTQHFTIVTGMVSTMIKIVNLWRRRLDIEELVDLLNYERRLPCNRKFGNSHHVLHEFRKIFRGFSVCVCLTMQRFVNFSQAIRREKIVTSTIRACKYFSLTFIVMVFWYALFIYGRILVYYKGNFDMLPLSPLVPVRLNNTIYYWSLFVYDEMTFFYIAGTVASHDSFFMVFLIHLGTQLDLLKERLTLCSDKACKVRDEDYIDRDEDLSSFDIEYVQRTQVQESTTNPLIELQICIEHHLHILRYSNLVQNIFNHTLLLQFASSLVMITMIGFQIIDGGQLSNNELIEHGTLLLCALFQLFLYCWFGTDIISKSEGVTLSAYRSAWYIADEPFKKTLKILMCNGQIPIKIRVGYVFEVSSATFMNIVSKCYSAMALLQRVDE